VGQKILVVEDNALNLKLFCDLLGAHGYETRAVTDGREALDQARDFAPDLVIMDIQMPHISGLELIEAMKSDEELRGAPIMAVTAYAAKGDEERIRDAGAEGYVSKPISLVRFIEAVSSLLGEREEKDMTEIEPPSGAAPPADPSSASGSVARAVEASQESKKVEAEVAEKGEEAAAKAVRDSEEGEGKEGPPI